MLFKLPPLFCFKSFPKIAKLKVTKVVYPIYIMCGGLLFFFKIKCYCLMNRRKLLSIVFPDYMQVQRKNPLRAVKPLTSLAFLTTTIPCWDK